MWKCKSCGCSSYNRAITGYCDNIKFDEDGQKIKGIDLSEYKEVECNECNVKGESIQDIAEWVEEGISDKKTQEENNMKREEDIGKELKTMAWKCKCCGKKHWFINRKQILSDTKLNEYGEVIQTDINDEEYEFECSTCGNESDYIYEIADYVDRGDI